MHPATASEESPAEPTMHLNQQCICTCECVFIKRQDHTVPGRLGEPTLCHSSSYSVTVSAMLIHAEHAHFLSGTGL